MNQPQPPVNKVAAADVAAFKDQMKQTSNNRTIGHYVVGNNLYTILIILYPCQFINSSFIGKTIGQGTFGKVRIGSHTLTGEKVAIKILEKDKIVDQADVERVTREIQILKIVRHPNVIQLYEIIETNR